MTYLETLRATIDRFASDPHASNASMAREDLKLALATIAHLEACLALELEVE